MTTNVTEWLDEAAEKWPDKEAFVDDKTVLTYCALRTQARNAATFLCQQTERQHPIAVYMKKSAMNLVAFAAATYANCFYVPIDEQMPVERILKIFEKLNPVCVFTDETTQEKAQQSFVGEKMPPLVLLADACNTQADEACLRQRRAQAIDTDLLYVLFTSGSTGMPKGVSICHRSVIDYTEWVCNTLGIDHDVRFGNQAPFHFDNSILDIYSSIHQGGTVYIIPRKCFMFPKLMTRYLKENQINTIFWVPYALITVANSGILQKDTPDCLKRVYFCGEVMPCKQLNIWRSVLPQAVYCNMYGPTEITDVCTYYLIDRDFADDDVLPIGVACKNTRIYLLTDEGQEAKPGEKGELCVGGTSLALGYFNDPEKTNKAFVQNPLNHSTLELIYRTGDIAHYNERGEIMYDGRKDFQIKHLGYRIELGEIESMANSLQEVRNGCCLFDAQGDKIIYCYEGTLDKDEITAQLKDKVPHYMLPNVFITYPKLPQTLNGKVNRVQLMEEYRGTH